MTDMSTAQPSARITLCRWTLLLLSGLFTLGAFAQFFLVGMSFFDDANLWNDHASLGHILGIFPFVLWIPSVLGKGGGRIVTACVVLFVLFLVQYAFIEIDNTVANAFHALNGSILLVLACWITQQSFGLLRRDRAITDVLPDKLEGTAAD